MTDALVTTDAAIQALLADPKKYGLIWDLRPGTVMNSSPLTVKVDGDDTEVSMTNIMVTPVQQGQRVYTVAVPPAGNFVIGKASQDQLATVSNGLYNGQAGTTTSATVANMPGPPTVTIRKKFAATSLHIQVNGTIFSSVATAAPLLSVFVSGVTGSNAGTYTSAHNIVVIQLANLLLNSHTPYAGSIVLPNLGAGTAVCTMRWLRLAGTGTLNVNADDFTNMTVSEVWPS